MEECGLDSSASRQRQACSCERNNKPSGSKKDEKFLEQLNDYQLLKKESGPWM
jgi:hypothetical protein